MPDEGVSVTQPSGVLNVSPPPAAAALACGAPLGCGAPPADGELLVLFTTIGPLQAQQTIASNNGKDILIIARNMS
jgi:hypothetical protein